MSPSIAIQATHGIDASVQIDHVLTAGRLVQSIDVLRDELDDASATFETRQRMVGVVGARMPHATEADEAPRPVALSRALVSDEQLERDGRAALPLAIGIAVVRNA